MSDLSGAHCSRARGFAGLSSLVSDVDGFLETLAREVQREPVVDAASSGGHAGTEQQEDTPRAAQGPPAPPKSGPGRWSLVAGIFGALGVATVAMSLAAPSESPRRPVSPTGAPPAAPSTEAPPPQRIPAPVPPTPARRQPAAATPPRLEEDPPPVGTNRILTVAQLRYCLAEAIRMDAADALVDPYEAADVDRFNSMVTDYNARCAEQRYYEDVLRRARADVEAHRVMLVTEGRRRLAGGS